MKKNRLFSKGLVWMIVLALFFSVMPAAFAESPIQLIVNGEKLQPDVPPQLIDQRVMVPVRWVSEALGADVAWDGDNARVLVDSSSNVELPSVNDGGSIQLVVNNELLQPDVSPQMINNRVMVPVRWVSEALGADVEWNQTGRTVLVTKDDSVASGSKMIPNKYDEPFVLEDDELFIFIENYGQFEIPGLLDKVIGNKLREAFPDKKIKLEVWDKPIRTTDLIDAGAVPDIYIATSREFIELIVEKNGWELDMTEWIDRAGIDLSGLNQAAVELVRSRSDGGLYGVPLFIDERVMYYNKDIFDKFGASYPTNGMTYDEVYELLPNVMGNEGAFVYKGFAAHPDHYLDFNQLGLLPFDPTSSEEPSLEELKASVNLTNDDWLRLVENMYRFLSKVGNDFTTTDDFFRRGNFAMTVDAINKLPMYTLSRDYLVNENDYQAYSDWAKRVSNIGIVSVPVLSEDENWTYQPNVLSMHLTKQSDKKEEAMEVIQWLISEEAQLQLSRNGLKAVLETDAVIDQFGAEIDTLSGMEGLGEAVYWGENAYVQNYENTEWPDFQRFPLGYVFGTNVLKNGLGPEEALKKAQEDVMNWFDWVIEESNKE